MAIIMVITRFMPASMQRYVVNGKYVIKHRACMLDAHSWQHTISQGRQNMSIFTPGACISA